MNALQETEPKSLYPQPGPELVALLLASISRTAALRLQSFLRGTRDRLAFLVGFPIQSVTPPRDIGWVLFCGKSGRRTEPLSEELQIA